MEPGLFRSLQTETPHAAATVSRSERAVDRFAPALLAVLALAFVFRLPTLADRSLWMDEAYSYWFSSLSWADLWTKTPLYETHPPFYYSLLKLWTGAAGTSEAALRALSVVASLATIALVAAAPRLAGFDKQHDRVGLLAAALLAINAGNIEYAQQARPYALQTLCCAAMLVASAALLRALLADSRRTARVSGCARLCVLTGVCAGLTLWLHNTSPFIILGNWAGLGVAILCASRYRLHDLLVASAALLVALVVWAPCVPIAVTESRTVASAFWATLVPQMVVWPFTLAAGGKFALLPGAALFALGAAALYRVRRGLVLYLAAVLVVPLAGVFVASWLIRPIFVVRTFEWVAPPFLLLVSAGVFALRRPARWRALAVLALALPCLAQDLGYYRSPTEDLRGLVGYLAAETRPGDLVLVYPNELEVGMSYYRRRQPLDVDVVPLPAPYPALSLPRPYLASNRGVPAAVDADRPRIARLLATRDHVWLVGDWPGADAPRDVVSDTLYRQWGLPASSADFQGTRATLFVRPRCAGAAVRCH